MVDVPVGELRAHLVEVGLSGDLRLVCLKYGVSLDEVLGPSRTKTIVRGRDACCAYLRARKMSAPEIAKLLGFRDHTSVLAACKRHAAREPKTG